MLIHLGKKLISKNILLLLAAGLLMLVIWRAGSASGENLLSNADFEADVAAWNVINLGGGQITSTAAANPDNKTLTFSIPDSDQGSAVGIAQSLSAAPLERYRFEVAYRLEPGGRQQPANLLWRLSQYDQSGALLKQDEILDSALPHSGANEWMPSSHKLLTEPSTSRIEVGLGIFGNVATTVEIDRAAFYLSPPPLRAINFDRVTLIALTLFVAILIFMVGRAVWPIKRKIALNGGLILASLLVTLLLLEIAVRFIPIRFLGPQWPAGYHVTLDAEPGYRLAKNYPATVMSNEHGDQTQILSNSLGLRDVEIPASDDQEIILIIGDSMTFGAVGDIVDSWPRRLDDHVDRITSGLDTYHFVNAGVSGYNTFQEVALLKTLINEMKQQGIKPQAVLLSFFSEIWGRNVYGVSGRFTVLNDVVLYSPLREALVNFPAWLVARSDVDDLKLLRLDKIQKWHRELLSKSKLYFMLSLLLATSFDEDFDRRPDNVAPDRVNLEVLKEFKETAEANGIEPVVAFMPAYYLFENKQRHEEFVAQLSAVCLELGLPLLNPYQNMQALGINADNAKTKLTLVYDSHYSVSGNSLYAEALAPLVVDYLSQEISEPVSSVSHYPTPDKSGSKNGQD